MYLFYSLHEEEERLLYVITITFQFIHEFYYIESHCRREYLIDLVSTMATERKKYAILQYI